MLHTVNQIIYPLHLISVALSTFSAKTLLLEQDFRFVCISPPPRFDFLQVNGYNCLQSDWHERYGIFYIEILFEAVRKMMTDLGQRAPGRTTSPSSTTFSPRIRKTPRGISA